MTLLEIMIVTVILALAASGLGFSLGALARANLKAAAGKLGAAVRYAYNRAVTHGTTVRIHFAIPGGTFSIEEAQRGVTLTSAREREAKSNVDEGGDAVAAIDPWVAAQAKLAQPRQPSIGASPFSPIAAAREDGAGKQRYQSVTLGRGVQFLRLIVPHEPEPLTEGDGALHFFPGGRTEHAVIHLGDGREGVYSVEVHPLTGAVKVRAEAYEPRDLLDRDDDDGSEVEAP